MFLLPLTLETFFAFQLSSCMFCTAVKVLVSEESLALNPRELYFKNLLKIAYVILIFSASEDF